MPYGFCEIQTTLERSYKFSHAFNHLQKNEFLLSEMPHRTHIIFLTCRLTFTPRTFVLAENSEMCSSPPPVLSHAYFGALSLDDCNTQINIGEGETNTNVSRFEASIVAPQGN